MRRCANRRFTQEDPIGLAGGFNLYGFAGGDPVNFVDPFGLAADSIYFTSEGAERLFAGTISMLKSASRTATSRIDRKNLELLLSEVEVVRASSTDHLTVGIGACERGGTGCYDHEKRTLTVDVDYIREAHWDTRRPVTTMTHELGHFLDRRRFFGVGSEPFARHLDNILRSHLGMCPTGTGVWPPCGQ